MAYNPQLPNIFVYTGNPNTHVAGNAGTVSGGPPPDLCWDGTNNILYACTTTGNAASAVWSSLVPTSASAYRILSAASVAGGTANALTVSTNGAIATAQQGHLLVYRTGPSANASGAVTIAADTSGAIALQLNGNSTIPAGTLPANSICVADFDGTYWRHVSATPAPLGITPDRAPSGALLGTAAFADAAQLTPSKSYQVPVTGKVVSFDPGTAGDYHSAIVGNPHTYVMEPAGTLATQTFTFPATARDGQIVTITSTQIVTTATFNGGTFVGAPAALAANTPVRFVFIADTGKWYIF